MATIQKPIWFLTAFFITFISSTHAYTLQVGGKDGWTLHPSENYNTWSSRLRFLINDTLHFKYDNRTDSVLVVNKSDYDGCNANNPIMKLDGGDSMFKFNRSGPFYFITGNKSNCDQGQKMVVVVLALRNRSPPPSVATPPSPSTQPPSPAASPALPPSARSPVVTPSMSPGGPGPSPSEDITPVTFSPDGGSVDPPSGGSTSSPNGGNADPPGNGQPPEGDQSPPSPRGAAVAKLPHDSIIALVVTLMVALWALN